MEGAVVGRAILLSRYPFPLQRYLAAKILIIIGLRAVGSCKMLMKKDLPGNIDKKRVAAVLLWQKRKPRCWPRFFLSVLV